MYRVAAAICQIMREQNFAGRPPAPSLGSLCPRRMRLSAPCSTSRYIDDAAVLKAFRHWLATGDEAPLAKAMGCKPWEIPVVHPDEPCPYPPETAAYTQWPEAQARYLLLSNRDW